MIFPIGDTNVKGGYKPLVSYTFIAMNIIVFMIQYATPGQLLCDFATIPNDILNGNKLFTLLTSMFMHGGFMHLLGNMLFLWVFADNIEAVIGNVRFIMFYILGGVFASGLHIFFESMLGANIVEDCCKPCLSALTCPQNMSICSNFIPSLGASGSISAVLGAYIVLFPRSRIKIFFFLTTFSISALAFLGIWFGEQLLSAIGALGQLGASGGVAWWAHIGGFIFGLAFGFMNKRRIQEMMLPEEQSYN